MFQTVIGAVSRTLAALSGFLIALVMAVVCLDVAIRFSTGGSLRGATEFAVLLLVALIFLGFAGAEAKGENYSVTLLTERLPFGGKVAFFALARLISASTIGLLAYLSWLKAIAATRAGEQSYGVIAFPIWPSRIIVAVGLTLLALQLLVSAVDARTNATRSISHD